MDTMDNDQDPVQEMWGVLKSLTPMEVDPTPNPKRQRADHQPPKGKGKGKHKSRKDQSHNPQDAELRPVVQALARLVLRHEDTLRGLAVDQDFMLFLSLGPGSSMVKMMQATDDWHQQAPTD